MAALVLSGGGVYGAALLGALHHLWFELHQDLICVAGTSIGAIIGTLLVVGHAPIDLLQTILSETEPLLTPDFTGYSVASQDRLRAIVQRLLLEKCDCAPTFAEVHERYGKDLVVTGTNLTTRKAVYFQRHNFPDMSVLDALMISSCVPFVFPYIQFQGDVYVDGFVTDNFPVRFVERFCSPDTIVYGLWTRGVPKSSQLQSFQDYAMTVFSTFLRSKTYAESPTIFRLDIHGDYNPLIAHANDLESIFYEGSACYINSLKENPRKGRDSLPKATIKNADSLSVSRDAVQRSVGAATLIGDDRTIFVSEGLGESEDYGEARALGHSLTRTTRTSDQGQAPEVHPNRDDHGT
jgi:predicted acylesterase/phospholipase RssA